MGDIIGAKIIGELRARMDKEAADKKCSMSELIRQKIIFGFSSHAGNQGSTPCGTTKVKSISCKYFLALRSLINSLPPALFPANGYKISF